MTIDSTFPRLQHGVNLSHWFGQVYMEPGYRPEHYDDYMQESDLDLIASAGFDHVRFPLALEQLWSDGRVVVDFADRVAREIARLHQRGLLVVVDLHPENEYKDALAISDQAVVDFVSAWDQIASWLTQFSPSDTVFEVLNEPGLGDAARWSSILRSAVETIRRRAADYTVIASGDQYSQVPELVKLPDLGEDVVYNFHLYDPVALSHQGAHWSHEWVQDTRGLAYPADEANISDLESKTRDPEALAALEEYRSLRWDRASYQAIVGEAVAWAAARGVRLTCNEFGIYKRYAPRDSRLRWLEDVTSVFRDAGIGWSVWDYAGEFSVVEGERGRRRLDQPVMDALGQASWGS